MRLPRSTLASIGFAVVLVAVNLASVRAAVMTELGDTDDVDMSGFAAFLVLPMIDALMIVAYRLRKPARQTARAVGFLAGGGLATVAMLAWILHLPMENAFEMLDTIAEPIDQAVYAVLAGLLGNWATGGIAEEIVDILFIEILVPVVAVSLPPLLAGLVTGWAARRVGPSWPRPVPAEPFPSAGC